MAVQPTVRLSVSQYFHNKENRAPMRPNKKKNGELYNDWAHAAYVNVRWTPETVVKHITSGKAICVSAFTKDYRHEDNFASAQIIGVDIDKGGVDIPTLLQDERIARYAFLVYYTASSTPEQPRARVLFILDMPIENLEAYKRITKRLLHRFSERYPGIDTSCKDAARVFYGSDKPGYHTNLSARLPMAVLEQLPMHPDELPKPEPEITRPKVDLHDSKQMTRALAYSMAARERMVADALAVPAGAGQRHNEFNGFVMGMIAKVKGGWPGFDASVESDIRYVGQKMGRDEDEIERSIKGAWSKAEPEDLRLDETPAANGYTPVITAQPANNPEPPPPVTWKTSDDSMARFRERLASSQNSFIPLLFPMNCLHDFGGFCHAVPPGILIGVVGMSGGMKTSFCETITDAWRQMDRNHILWWGAEWTWEKMADRAITRYGDTKTPTASLTEIMLHEMYLAEEAAGIPEKGRYGRKLPDFVYRSSIATSQLIEKWPGKSHYLERMNIEFDALMAQFEQRVLALEAEGNRPKVAVFDYVQLLDLPNMRTEGDRITAALGRIKAFCVDYKLVGIVASQVTKNTSKDARENGQLIDAEAGQFFRSDKFNLVLTLNPIYENGLLTTKGVIRVAKNSVGRTGQQKVFIDPARFKWLDKKVESQSTDEIIEEAFSNAEIEF